MKFAKGLSIGLAIVLMAGVAWGQTTLSPGDLMMVTVNADGSDNFDFVPLVDLEAGTIINFTDNAWVTSSTALTTNEGTLVYKASGSVSKGTVVSYPGSTGGEWLSGGGSFNCATSGDNILAYQGNSNSPTFIYGIGWAISSPWPYNSNTNTSDIPSNLSAGAYTIVSLGTADNYQYSTSNGTSGSPLELRELISNPNNWNGNSSAAYTALSASFTVISGVPTAIISADPALTERNLNGKEINIELANETFADASLNSGNFTLNNAPAGVTVNSVAYGTTTTATVTLAYDGTDFDADINNCNIVIAGAELTGGNPLTSNNLIISHVAEEPGNHVASFTGAVISDVMAKVTWTDNNDAGDPADGFLLEGYLTALGSVFSPTDGDDSPSATNSVFAWVGTGIEEHTFTGLTAETQYTVRIWPYSGSGSSIDYKTDGTVPSVSATTDAAHTVIGMETFDSGLGVMTVADVSGTVSVWSHNSTDSTARADGYVYGGSGPEEEWLVSPAMNLDNFSDDVLYFETAYQDGIQDVNNYLKAYYTTSYTTPEASSWTEIPFLLPQAEETMSHSGLLDISGISGTDVVFAFKYYSTDNPRRWDVDNIYMTGIALVSASAPEVFTGTVLDVTHDSATLNGWVDANFADATVTFEYGETDSYGSEVTANESPVQGGDVQVDVTANLSGLDPETTYHFRVKAVNSEGTTYGDDATFTTTAAPVIPKLIISEVTDPNDNPDARFIEIFNNSGGTVNFSNQTWYLSRQANGSTWGDLQLTGALSDGEIFVIGYGADYTNFKNAYGFDPDMSSGFISGNGNDGYFLYYGGNHTSGVLVDAYGVIDEDGTGKAWEYENKRAVRSGVTQGNPTWTASEWTISTANVADCTPGELDVDQSLPVTLISFTAKAVKGTVVLKWETSAEIENQGFVLSRKERGTSSESVIATFATDDALKGQGSTTEATRYAFTDASVEPGKTYIYILADVDYSGNETILEKVEVKVETEEAVVADGYVLDPVYPNPFNATLTIPFTLTEGMNVSIELYSITGQKMMTVVNREFGAGSYNYTVQTDDLASGIYFVRISFNGRSHMHKAVLLK